MTNHLHTSGLELEPIDLWYKLSVLSTYFLPKLDRYECLILISNINVKYKNIYLLHWHWNCRVIHVIITAVACGYSQFRWETFHFQFILWILTTHVLNSFYDLIKRTRTIFVQQFCIALKENTNAPVLNEKYHDFFAKQ